MSVTPKSVTIRSPHYLKPVEVEFKGLSFYKKKDDGPFYISGGRNANAVVLGFNVQREVHYRGDTGEEIPDKFEIKYTLLCEKESA